MQSDRVALVRTAFDRFSNGDVAGVLALLDPDVEIPDMVHDTMVRGRESVGEMWRGQFRLVEHTVLPGEIVDMGDIVVAVAHHQLYEPNHGPLGPGVTVVHRLSFRNGLISRLEVTPIDEVPEEVRARLR